MFFMMGISSGRKDIDFTQTILCKVCGGYGRYQVFMTYTMLSLFFIPCIKWNKHYYVQSTCCNTIYELDKEMGNRIARGENLEIRPENLQIVQGSGSRSFYKRCNECGYETTEDFEFCPKCGNRF